MQKIGENFCENISNCDYHKNKSVYENFLNDTQNEQSLHILCINNFTS